MYDVTKLVSQKQFDILLKLLPQPRQKKEGRRRCTKESLLNGILQVLVNGGAWARIAECGASYTSCWRYCNELQRRGKLKLLYEALANKQTDVIEGSIDTTTATSFRFRRMTGWDGKHKKIGTKVSLFTDKYGLPADVAFGCGNDSDPSFLATHLTKTIGRRKKILNLDRVYVSLELRRKMRRKGTFINMQMRRGDYIRKRGPKFSLQASKYKMRFLVERMNGWLKAFRHIRIRRDYLPAMFKAFVYLALIIVLIRSS